MKGDRSSKPSRPNRPRGTLGGKFESIGSAEQQGDNLALVTKLMGEIDRAKVAEADRFFIEDVQSKLAGSPGIKRGMFGWRQVEAVVRIHKYVMEAA